MATNTTVVTVLLAAGLVASASTSAWAQGHETHAAPAPTTPSAAPLDPKVLAGVHEALADERKTEEIYRAVMETHGERRPFSNTVHAEARHAEFLEGLLTARGLAVPERPKAETAAVPATIQEACAAAVAGEKDNVAIYDRLLASGPLPEDVKRVFEHNRWASQERHLPAFERCAGAAGSTATAGRGFGRCGRGAGGPGRGQGPGGGPGPQGRGRGHGCGCGCPGGCGPAGAAAKPAGAGA